MATVSILIPAYKARFLGRALTSAQGQTFDDIEILVGDDTPDAALEQTVRSFADPRIQYFHHGFQKGTRNSQALLQRASGKYIKWLYDDDVLMPTSVEALVEALRAHPESAMAFHGRVIIDENDAVSQVPPPLLKDGERALIDRALLVREMVGKLNNFIGEPSNIMFNRERLIDAAGVFDYRSWKLDFLGDVAIYLNLSAHGPLVAVGGYLSAFRRHDGQSSNALSPNFSAGLYEWELMVRGEAGAGYLEGEALASAQQLLTQLYSNWAGKLPELAHLLGNLQELIARPTHELFASQRFQADLERARSAVAARVAARRKPVAQAAPVAQKFCVVCDKPVTEWLPHPAAGSDRDFMQQVESVGSTLEKHHCPNCYCNDRDRHLWLYFAYSGLLENASSKRILHIAPEARLEPRIRALEPMEYIAGDLFPRSPAHRKINVESLDFPGGYFDLIICNHVLEHVDNPAQAIAEFSRCLTPTGHLVAQTPYSPVLKHTFELNRPVSGAFATRYFGQDDHVRLFGADIVDYFRGAGLSGDLYPHKTVLGEIDPDVVGCNVREPFFLFSKGHMPAFSA
ncbi:glycosyltransferase [Paraburkholderia sp. BL10I2N1]|uniref:glycosyltransferase n=1 Tax=Paraburkholderia sp. BL10I2N1 TaxID=1938796 RepID=UPI00105E1DCB|nr:glycosyltransferase [Paraburkholderia sp. BL10I2N1]TDN68011.1 methyltransferase family protein [Paraburkholderia sp. BL10I2N1]